MIKSNRIIDKLLSNVGLLENIFGKSTDLIIYDTEKEKVKRILMQIYNKKDVGDLFPPELDNSKVREVLNILFTYYDNGNNITEGGK